MNRFSLLALPLVLAAVAMFFCTALEAQTSQPNIALSATATHSGGGTGSWGPDRLNNDDTQGTYNDCWTSRGGWVQYDWTTPVNIGSIKIWYTRYRSLGTQYDWQKGNIQYHDGNGWQTLMQYTAPNTSIVADDEIEFPNAVTTTQLRVTHDASLGGSNFMIQEWQVFPPKASEWTGDVSSDWNNPLNWKDGDVPNEELGADIPPAGSVPNTPVLSSTAECLDLILQQGSILKGGNGTLKIFGNWKNDGGAFQHENSLVIYSSDDDQEVQTAGASIGNVQNSNTSGTVLIMDEFSAVNTGEFTLDAGSIIRFMADANLSNTSFTSDGLVRFGVDTLIQTVTGASGLDVGPCQVDSFSASDEVIFTGEIGFGDGTVFQGPGVVTFLNAVVCDSSAAISFNAGTMNASATFTCGAASVPTNGTLTIAGTLNCSSLTVDHSDVAGSSSFGGVDTTGAIIVRGFGTTTFGGPVTCASASFFGPATINLNGDVTATGDILVTSDATISSIATFAGDLYRYEGTVSIVMGGLDVNRAEFEGTGQVTVSEAVQTDDLYLRNGDEVVFNNNVNLSSANSMNGKLDASGDANMTFNAEVRIYGDVELRGTADYTFNDNLFLSGDLEDYSTGSALVDGMMTLEGQTKQTLLADAHTFVANQFNVTGPGGSDFLGEFQGRGVQGNPNAEALHVSSTSALNVSGTGRMILGELFRTGRVLIEGVLVMEADPNVPSQRAYMGAHPQALGALLETSGNSALIVLNGAVLEGFGTIASSYAITFGNGTDIRTFNRVSIIGADATTAIIDLNTSLIPNTIADFEISADNPVNVSNIDANTITRVPAARILHSLNGGGNLYGEGKELDDNDSLLWEDPTPIEFETKTLPNALVSNSYDLYLQAVGGNKPYTWSITNGPSWLSIDATSGRIFGIPQVADVGVHQFPVTILDSSFPAQSVSRVFTIVVDQLTTVELEILTTTVTRAKVGDPYGFQLTAGGGIPPYNWEIMTASSLPKGLSLAPGGTITGIPENASAGTYDMQVRIADSGNPINTLTATLKLTVLSESSDPDFVALASAEQGSSCSMSDQSASWSLLALMAMLGMAILRRRMREEQA